MDTLVFLCQHTCTMVLPRWGAGLSSEVCDAAVSSSDSVSTTESSRHSGKVSKLLLLKRVMRARAPLRQIQSSGVQRSHVQRHLSAFHLTFWCSPHFLLIFRFREEGTRVRAVVQLTVSGQTAGQKVRWKPVGGFCHLYGHPHVLHPLLHLCQRAGEQKPTITCR